MNQKIRIKSFLIILCISCFCTSCKETVNETLQILIQNKTDSIIKITLFTKKDIGGLYPICEGCGGHKETEFKLINNIEARYKWDEVIFITSDLNIEPYTLASKAFDSIYIHIADNLIIFTHEDVKGYTENIFSENSKWDFIKQDDELNSSSRKKNQIYHQYRFLILEEKIII